MIVISGLSARFLRSLNATFNPKATMAINKQIVDTVFKIFSNADGIVTYVFTKAIMTNPIKKYGMLIRPLLDDSDERKRIIKISTMVNGISKNTLPSLPRSAILSASLPPKPPARTTCAIS